MISEFELGSSAQNVAGAKQFVFFTSCLQTTNSKRMKWAGHVKGPGEDWKFEKKNYKQVYVHI